MRATNSIAESLVKQEGENAELKEKLRILTEEFEAYREQMAQREEDFKSTNVEIAHYKSAYQEVNE